MFHLVQQKTGGCNWDLWRVKPASPTCSPEPEGTVDRSSNTDVHCPGLCHSYEAREQFFQHINLSCCFTNILWKKEKTIKDFTTLLMPGGQQQKGTSTQRLLTLFVPQGVKHLISINSTKFCLRCIHGK